MKEDKFASIRFCRAYALLYSVLGVALPFLVRFDSPAIEQSMIETEKQKAESVERATGEERPGQTPSEAIQGSHSGTTVGRASDPFGTKGRPLRGDPWD